MEFVTTTYENVKNRAEFLTQEGGLSENAGNSWNHAAEFAFALCEEIDELKKEIEKLKGDK